MIDLTLMPAMRLQLASLKDTRLLALGGSMEKNELVFDDTCILKTTVSHIEMRNEFSVNPLFDTSEEVTCLRCRNLAKDEQADFSLYMHGAYDISVGERIHRIALVNDEVGSAQPNFPLVKTTAIALYIDSGVLCLSQGMFIDNELCVAKSGDDWMGGLRSVQEVAGDFDAWGKHSPVVTRKVIEL